MTRTVALLVMAVGGLASAGCGGFDTPRGLRGSPPPDRADLSTEEQYRRGRARYGIVEDDPRVGPRTFADRYGPTGGGVGGGVAR